MERVLANIIVATVGLDLLDMTVLRLIVALSQHHALVRQEHGRTIPLADMEPSRGKYQVVTCLVPSGWARHPVPVRRTT